MTATPAGDYPAPRHISYSAGSRWCQDHGHTGLLVGSVCEICDSLVATRPEFEAVLGTLHAPDGSRADFTPRRPA
jgi:hypothetical protein